MKYINKNVNYKYKHNSRDLMPWYYKNGLSCKNGVVNLLNACEF